MKYVYLTFICLCSFLASLAADCVFKVENLYYSVLSEEEKTVAVENGNKLLREVKIIDFPSRTNASEPLLTDNNDEPELGGKYDEYSGDYCEGNIVIPATIEVDGEIYTVTELAEGAFSYCCRVESLTLPETITAIGAGAFYFCCGISEIIFPESVKEIGEAVVRHCYGLKRVYWPSAVTVIPYGAFADTGSEDGSLIIENIENVTILEDGAFANTALEDYPYWNNLTEIGRYAFYQGRLKRAVISEKCSVTDSSFSGCKDLRLVDLPANCPDNISDSFMYSGAIQHIRIAATVPPVLNKDWTVNVAPDCVLEVPEESVELYREAPYWSNFSEIRISGVEAVDISDFKAIGLKGVLRVSSPGEAKVFDTQGLQLHSGTDFEVRLPAGLYIVKSGQAKRKVQVK